MYKNREVIDFLEDTLNAMVKAELFIEMLENKGE